MTKIEYSEYLQSKHWKELRKRFYKKNKKVCSVCGATKKIQLHHLTYIRLGKERLSDLMSVCDSCHHLIHKKKIKIAKLRKKKKHTKHKSKHKKKKFSKLIHKLKASFNCKKRYAKSKKVVNCF